MKIDAEELKLGALAILNQARESLIAEGREIAEESAEKVRAYAVRILEEGVKLAKAELAGEPSDQIALRIYGNKSLIQGELNYAALSSAIVAEAKLEGAIMSLLEFIVLKVKNGEE